MYPEILSTKTFTKFSTLLGNLTGGGDMLVESKKNYKMAKPVKNID